MTDALLDALVVPVVALHRADDALGLAEALVRGGLQAIEVTFRTDAADEGIRAIATRSDIAVGAGTVTTVEEAKRAIGSGAQFLISPGISREVAVEAARQQVPLIPGIATASDLQLARDMGISRVKLFPAELLGGIAMIDALHAPFPEMQFFPSGGLTLESAPAYLLHENVFAIGGSWMVPSGALVAGDWGEVERLSSLTVQALRSRGLTTGATTETPRG